MADQSSLRMDPSRIMLAVLLVVIMMMGVGAMYMMSVVTGEDDERAEDHDFTVTGTSSGTAHSEYYNEKDGEYIYRFTFDVAPVFDGEVTLIMDGDGLIKIGSGYSDLGKDSEGLSVYRVVDGGYTYEFHMDDDYAARTFTVAGEGVSLTGVLKERPILLAHAHIYNL